MKLPLFEKSKRMLLTVPAFCGGTDTNEAPWLLSDDTLSDCCDVWWKDGALRTRPGFWTAPTWGDSVHADAQIRHYADREGWILEISAQEKTAETVLTLIARTPSGGTRAELAKLHVPLGTTYACVPAGGSVGDYTLLVYVSDRRIWAVHPARWLATEVTDRIHVPIVSRNGHPCQGLLLTDSEEVMHQQRNCLTDRVRCCFTPDGVGTYYHLPYERVTGPFYVYYSGMAGSTWTYTIPDGDNVSDTQEGRRVVLDRYSGMFYFMEKDNTAVLPNLGVDNNVVAECGVPLEQPLVFDMTFGCWYGGDKSSTGGQRLFLGGHARKRNAVVWSVAEDPFYFPENAVATVGVSGEAVTAFGKQDGNLVMFKEHEIYTAEYIRGGADANDVAEQVFPVYALNTEIGCDLPQTVGLVGNRLIWACRDGNVYRLTRLNATGSRNAESIGAPIKRILKSISEGASAQVFDGVYYLLCGEQIAVLTDSEKVRWYRFAWPNNGFTPMGMYRSKEGLLIAARAEGMVQWFSLERERDVFPMEGYEERPITGMVCTKAYDFGEPAVSKQVLYAAVQSARTVKPSYITEHGEKADCEQHPDAGGLVRCTPPVSRCRYLAIRLVGEELIVGGLTLAVRAERGTGW